MCTSARTQFSSELWEARSGLGRPCRTPRPCGRPSPTAAPGPDPAAIPAPRPPRDRRGRGRGGRAAPAKGLMAAAPPAGSPRSRRRSPGGGGVGRRRLSGLLPPSPPVTPSRREAAQRLPSLGFRSPSPRAGAAFDNCKDNRESVTTRSRYARPGRGRDPGPAAAPLGRRRRETPTEGGAPEVEPSPSGRPGGHRGTFCSPRSPGSREGHGRSGRDGPGPREGAVRREAAGPPSTVCPREAPKGETRPSGRAFSDHGQKPESKSGPRGEKRQR